MLPWQQHSKCHYVSFVMYISGAKFEEHCSNIFVSFPQKRNGIVFSSGVNYLHSGGNIQSELSS